MRKLIVVFMFFGPIGPIIGQDVKKIKGDELIIEAADRVVERFRKLEVKAGETLQIGQEIGTYKARIRGLVMEDNSTIVLHPSIKDAFFKIKKARIGKNCRILMNGIDAIDAKPRTGTGANGGRCNSGRTGSRGLNATQPGNDAANLYMDICFISVNEMIIEAAGGSGGDGGRGQRGGAGGRGWCSGSCGGGRGGNGGVGGNGSDGGNGGDVIITYRIARNGITIDSKEKGLEYIASDSLINEFQPPIYVYNNGGLAGKQGAGGPGGPGGGGSSECGPWPHWRYGGGPGGSRGSQGKAGVAGENGRIDLIRRGRPPVEEEEMGEKDFSMDYFPVELTKKR